MSTMEHNVYLVDASMTNHGHGFVMFNDGELSVDPIGPEDLEPIQIAPGSPCASATWSCGLDWYFLRLPFGLALLNVHTGAGLLCRKLSSEFVRWFIERPTPPVKRRGKLPTPAAAPQGAEREG